LLVDSRHGLKDKDRDVMTMLDEAAVAYQIVLTKADKIKSAQQQSLVEKVSGELAKHTAAHPQVMLTSSEKGTGIADLRATLAALALPR
ncbi:MAG: YihA family ribosome biogenesis GTP-binding protein, partial [Rhodospirillales bacterium]|nr:YihA family ribosome biogenesis GTP-binding protein [Rhodospirillales bacterium]